MDIQYSMFACLIPKIAVNHKVIPIKNVNLLSYVYGILVSRPSGHEYSILAQYIISYGYKCSLRFIVPLCKQMEVAVCHFYRPTRIYMYNIFRLGLVMFCKQQVFLNVCWAKTCWNLYGYDSTKIGSDLYLHRQIVSLNIIK